MYEGRNGTWNNSPNYVQVVVGNHGNRQAQRLHLALLCLEQEGKRERSTGIIPTRLIIKYPLLALVCINTCFVGTLDITVQRLIHTRHGSKVDSH